MFTRTDWIHGALRLALAIGASVLTGSCKSQGTSGGREAQADTSTAVARVGDGVISIADVQARMNKQPVFVRSRYSDPAQRKSFVENLVRIEALAQEARSRGFDRDPDVLEQMKQAMVSKYLQKDVESHLRPEDVPVADVERYYREHSDQFGHPEQVLICQIVIKDKAKAVHVAELAHAVDRIDEKAFRDLVAKYSEDEESKARRGDVPAFGHDTTVIAKPVVEAAFQLKEVGDSSPPINSGHGYHILKLMQKRPAYSRSLADARVEIQNVLARDTRAKAMDRLVEELEKKFGATINDVNLAKVVVDSGPDRVPVAPLRVAEPDRSRAR